MTLFTLPTSGPRTYRGKYPTRVRSVSIGATGLHLELNNGTRFWSYGGGGNFPAIKPGYDFAPFVETAHAMTPEQYATLCEAAGAHRKPIESVSPADKARERDGKAGTVRRLLESIIPADPEGEAAARAESCLILADELPAPAYDESLSNESQAATMAGRDAATPLGTLTGRAGELIGIRLTFAVPDTVTFDPDELDSAMAANGWECDSQCDHMSFAALSLSHTDLGLAAIEAATFARQLAKWFKELESK